MVRSADLMTKTILNDKDLVAELKTDPAAVLVQQSTAAIDRIPINGDPWVYKIAVGALGALVIIVIGGLIYLDAHRNYEAPESLVALASAAVGALAGLLAPPGTR